MLLFLKEVVKKFKKKRKKEKETTKTKGLIQSQRAEILRDAELLPFPDLSPVQDQAARFSVPSRSSTAAVTQPVPRRHRSQAGGFGTPTGG